MIRLQMRIAPTNLSNHKLGRTVLYGSIIIAIVALVLSSYLLGRPDEQRADQTWGYINYSNLPEVQLLQEYVRINTNTESGSEIEGARFLARQLEAAGIEATIESFDENRANLWAIIEGKSPEAVVLHNHIDVSPILNPDKWMHPPFEAFMDLPWLYGRGTFDMKSVAIAQLQAMIDLKESGVQPERSVIFLATGGEESGSELGTQWILRQHPELVERFWAVLTEGGVAEASSADQIIYWGIEVGQRKYVNVYFCGNSRSQLEGVWTALIARAAEPRRGQVTPAIRSFVESWAPTRGHPLMRSRLASPDAFVLDSVALDGFPRHIQSLFLSEATPFGVEKSPGGGYQLRVVIQLIPGAEFDQVRTELLPKWLTHGLNVRMEPQAAGHMVSSTDHPVYLHAQSILEENLSGSGTVGPWILTWSGTDSRFFEPMSGSPSRVMSQVSRSTKSS
jgi:acetylornithine deacetylase/succinyl-diaminopimelate desuccinylase-like protein